jgi:hypothetical protein
VVIPGGEQRLVLDDLPKLPGRRRLARRELRQEPTERIPSRPPTGQGCASLPTALLL